MSFFLRNSSWCPQPFPACTRAASQLRGRRRLTARIDFVALDPDVAASVRRAEVLADLPVATGSVDDHFVAAVRLPVAGQIQRTASKSWYCRGGLRLPEVQEQLAGLWRQVPPYPPGLPLAAKATLFAKLCRMMMAEVSPPGTPCPEKPYLSAETWSLIRCNNVVKKQLFAARRTSLAAACGRFFAVGALLVGPASAVKAFGTWSMRLPVRQSSCLYMWLGWPPRLRHGRRSSGPP